MQLQEQLQALLQLRCGEKGDDLRGELLGGEGQQGFPADAALDEQQVAEVVEQVLGQLLHGHARFQQLGGGLQQLLFISL